MKLFLSATAVALAMALAAKAETTAAEPKSEIIKVKGMHCQSCVATIKKTICKPDLYASCEVKLDDAKKKLGHVEITPKTGQTVDTTTIHKDITQIGYEVK